jgi:hypothetical protein
VTLAHIHASSIGEQKSQKGDVLVCEFQSLLRSLEVALGVLVLVVRPMAVATDGTL